MASRYIALHLVALHDVHADVYYSTVSYNGMSQCTMAWFAPHCKSTMYISNSVANKDPAAMLATGLAGSLRHFASIAPCDQRNYR